MQPHNDEKQVQRGIGHPEGTTGPPKQQLAPPINKAPQSHKAARKASQREANAKGAFAPLPIQTMQRRNPQPKKPPKQHEAVTRRMSGENHLEKMGSPKSSSRQGGGCQT